MHCRHVTRAGSSPLTRGKRGDAPAGPAFLGLIPAHAGKTGCPESRFSCSRAHPRSRGENAAAAGKDAHARGSSPLTRGKLSQPVRGGPSVGLIPAHAGKTAHQVFIHPHERAHPRSRGENAISPAEFNVGRGSSPLTRGKPRGCLGAAHGGGLIPAHAGKTSLSQVTVNSNWAHPRSRGENFCPRLTHLSSEGSSPLTRGKPSGPAAGFALIGLIPAHAGKTGCWPRIIPPARAHPRSRGENPGRSPT